MKVERWDKMGGGGREDIISVELQKLWGKLRPTCTLLLSLKRWSHVYKEREHPAREAF